MPQVRAPLKDPKAQWLKNMLRMAFTEFACQGFGMPRIGKVPLGLENFFLQIKISKNFLKNFEKKQK